MSVPDLRPLYMEGGLTLLAYWKGYPLLLYFPVSFTIQGGLPYEEGHPI